ncbi:MAG: terminase family protein [Clostridia bacterium]|nr:terminase family protein [Clostridia bacterium]
MKIKVDYTPNAKQSEFHANGADEVCYGGAKGGGKSCALVMECYAYCLEYAGASAYLFRETYDDLEANIVKEWKAKVPKETYTYSESKHIATLVNGSTVHFRYISNDNDAEGYQGRSIDFIGVDELTKHSEKAVQILLSCLRSPKGFPTRFRATCNPGGKGHTWVKRRYIEGTAHGRKRYTDPVSGNTVSFIPATVYDNTVLMKNDPAYVRRLENLPEAERKAFLLGDWDIFEGQYFGEYRYEIHTCDPFPIPKHWRIYRSMDYGLDCFAMLWIACDDIGGVWVFKELAQSDMTISSAAQKANDLTDEMVYDTLAPPDLWNRSQETGKSKALLFEEAGLPLNKSNNDREAGWLSIRELLKLDANGEPRLHIFRNCTRLINDLPQLQHDEKHPTDCANEPHEITHVPDALRYFAISWTQPADPKAREKVNILPFALRTEEDDEEYYEDNQVIDW